MMKIKVISFFVVLYSLALVMQAQQKVGNPPTGNWVMYFGSHKLNDKFGLHSELQLRSFFISNTFSQTLSRVGLNYFATESLMLTSGYGLIHNGQFTDEQIGVEMLEHRIWEQVILRQKVRKLRIEHRYRLEQRFIQNRELMEFNYRDRIRYRLMLLYPLNELSPLFNRMFVSFYNEPFMNIGGNAKGQFFDRNRLFFSVGYQLTKVVNIQVGYLNQVIAMPNSHYFEINHNFQLAFGFNVAGIGDLVFQD